MSMGGRGKGGLALPPGVAPEGGGVPVIVVKQMGLDLAVQSFGAEGVNLNMEPELVRRADLLCRWLMDPIEHPAVDG